MGLGAEIPLGVPDKITELVPMEDIIALNVLSGANDRHVGRALRVQVLDDERIGMASQRVDVTVTKVLILDPAGTLDCNSATAAVLKDTLEGANLLKPCSTRLSASPPVSSEVPPENVSPGPSDAHSNYTDDLGMTTFGTLEVRDGPPGLYEFAVTATRGDTTASHKFAVEVASNVSMITVRI